jgi:hypothetical protein
VKKVSSVTLSRKEPGMPGRKFGSYPSLLKGEKHRPLEAAAPTKFARATQIVAAWNLSQCNSLISLPHGFGIELAVKGCA